MICEIKCGSWCCEGANFWRFWTSNCGVNKKLQLQLQTKRAGDQRGVKLWLSLSEMGNAGRVRNISDEVFPGILVGDKWVLAKGIHSHNMSANLWSQTLLVGGWVFDKIIVFFLHYSSLHFKYLVETSFYRGFGVSTFTFPILTPLLCCWHDMWSISHKQTKKENSGILVGNTNK